MECTFVLIPTARCLAILVRIESSTSIRTNRVGKNCVCINIHYGYVKVLKVPRTPHQVVFRAQSSSQQHRLRGGMVTSGFEAKCHCINQDRIRRCCGSNSKHKFHSFSTKTDTNAVESIFRYKRFSFFRRLLGAIVYALRFSKHMLIGNAQKCSQKAEL